MKFATVGTGKIVKEFILTTKQFPNLIYKTCYSRNEQTATKFLHDINQKNIDVSTNLEDISDIDFIYIASPNGLHYEQAKLFLQKKIHVLLEKPSTFLKAEIEELKFIANKNKVILMEAIKNIHCLEFLRLQTKVSEMNVNSAIFNENNYSSRMKDVNNKIFNSVFDSVLGKGNVYDILVYPVELAIALFGKVKEIKSMTNKLENGVSVADFVILRHENDVVTTITSSKNNYQTVKSQIFAGVESIEIDDLGRIRSFLWKNHETNDLNEECKEPNQLAMYGEIVDFIEMIEELDFAQMNDFLDISIETIRVLELVATN